MSDGVLVERLPDALDGERVDRVVAMLADCSRAEAAALIGDAKVLLDDQAVTKASTKVRAGAVLSVTALPTATPERLDADPSVEFAVVHEDDDVVVVDKPAGLVVHPGAGHDRGTLVHGLVARYPDLAAVGDAQRPGLVHRLDRGTSGLLVVARTPEAHSELVEQLSSHTVARVYTALAWGHPEHRHGVIDAPIGRSRRDPLRMAVVVDGRPSRTHYRVDRTFDDPAALALLTCELETGRTHQIRVHLASVGHPVVGDDVYGGRRLSLEVPRPFLHARELSFVHPGTGEQVGFRSPLPGDLQHVLDRLA